MSSDYKYYLIKRKIAFHHTSLIHKITGNVCELSLSECMYLSTIYLSIYVYVQVIFLQRVDLRSMNLAPIFHLKTLLHE